MAGRLQALHMLTQHDIVTDIVDFILGNKSPRAI